MEVEIVPGCIGCGACESINSEVFILNTIASINQENILGNEDDCRTAAEACPVSVIIITEENSDISVENKLSDSESHNYPNPTRPKGKQSRKASVFKTGWNNVRKKYTRKGE